MTRVNCWPFNSRPATPMTANRSQQMTKKLWGGVVVDRGYLSQVFFEQCFAQGLQLMAADRPLPIALTRKNMQNRLVVL